ncbi:hypothetical protein AB4027_04710 [Alkalibacterium putridalgicola]|uniref:hypothetical protein n=1 Tax=Alkalibacterium putridalgicola TaxID=426703 RepID=UPI0034CF4471
MLAGSLLKKFIEEGEKMPDNIGNQSEDELKNKEKNSNNKRKTILNSVGTSMSQQDLNQLHGEATSQMIQAQKGIRVDSFGNHRTYNGRSFEDISNYKINKEYESQNIKQQAGFSAELIKEARDNKEAILRGDKTRTRTTDDVGTTNDTKHDHVRIDEHGQIIDNSGSQLKVYGYKTHSNGSIKSYDVLDKIVKKNSSWDRYETIEIPSDQYDGVLKQAAEKSNSLREQGKKLLERGDTKKAQERFDQAERYETIKSKVKKSNFTYDEAIQNRKNHFKFTAKEVAKDSHNAGVEAVKASFIMSSSLSVGQNLFQVLYNDKDIEEAAKDVGIDVVKTSAVAYTTGASGTAIKAMMHGSRNQTISRLGTTNAPTMLVTSITQTTTSLIRYGKGEIDEYQLLEELGEKGTGMVAASYGAAVGGVVGATIGTAILPGAGTAVLGTAGSFIGATLGSTMSSVLYKGTMEALEEEKLSFERRKVIEEISEQSVQAMNAYRESLIAYSNQVYSEREEVIRKSLDNLNHCILNNDVDSYFKTMNQLGNTFGVKLQFDSFEEFDEFMTDKDTIFKL